MAELIFGVCSVILWPYGKTPYGYARATRTVRGRELPSPPERGRHAVVLARIPPISSLSR